MQIARQFSLAAGAVAFFMVQSLAAQSNSVTPLHTSQVSSSLVQNVSIRTMAKIGGKSDSLQPAGSDKTYPGVAGRGEGSEGFYPGDLADGGAGPTVQAWQHHPIYVNSAPATWGNVPQFLNDLGRSWMMHVVDQYVGAYGYDRYRLGTQFQAQNYPIPTNNTLGLGDLYTLVYAGASSAGVGYGHIYHVFLPPGVDFCYTAASGQPECYSPDNPATFAYCAFHGSVDFTGLGHVLFSLEPYQNVPGCQEPPTGTANNQLVDSTDSVLSHESFEAITDPDGDAWWVQKDLALYGSEIGDVCEAIGFFGQNVYFDNGTVDLHGRLYTIQPEYSNSSHSCAYSPEF
jgi:hypothetical protein